ncbi:hypothetical protein MKEN_00996800 [Mycena kentingensis (nom. inval.)]|nr:hypothetical protein MKEN_00996800 [Mycena kentingensis (nom. inval.)]
MTDVISPEAALSWMRLQTVKYVNVASLTILAFDYLLTLDMEMSLIWPSRISLSKTLFFLARYTPFFDVPVGLCPCLEHSRARDSFSTFDSASVFSPVNLQQVCRDINTAFTVMSVFGIIVGEAILVLRTFALAERSKRVLLIFGSVYLAAALTSIVLVALFLKSMVFGPPIHPLIPGCNETDGDFLFVGISFILLLVNETALMSYTIYLGWRKYRHLQNPFIVTLYRDGITYFVFLFLGSAANFAILLGGQGELQELLSTFLRVMHSVLSTRILLHVRDVERARRWVIEERRTSGVVSGTGMIFAAPALNETELDEYGDLEQDGMSKRPRGRRI